MELNIKGGIEIDNLHMRSFYLAFPIWNAVCSELGWTHYRILMRQDADSYEGAEEMTAALKTDLTIKELCKVYAIQTKAVKKNGISNCPLCGASDPTKADIGK